MPCRQAKADHLLSRRNLDHSPVGDAQALAGCAPDGAAPSPPPGSFDPGVAVPLLKPAQPSPARGEGKSFCGSLSSYAIALPRLGEGLAYGEGFFDKSTAELR